MDTQLDRLQRWYWRHCDGDWEHCYGITIETMDNPGWLVRIDLNETELEQEGFDPVSVHRGQYDWLECSVAASRFQGSCSPTNLSQLLEVFNSWARGHDQPMDIFVAVDHSDIQELERIAAESPEQIARPDGDYGYTALYHAVYGGVTDVVELLLRNHADVNHISPKTGMSPIFAALADASMASLLLSHGASVRIADRWGKTPLHWAVEDAAGAEAERVVRLLLEHGADPNAVDTAGNAPLHIAIAGGNEDAVRCLMSRGADPTLPNAEGVTPKQSALEHGLDLYD